MKLVIKFLKISGNKIFPGNVGLEKQKLITVRIGKEKVTVTIKSRNTTIKY